MHQSNWPVALLADTVLFTGIYAALTTGNDYLSLIIGVLYWLILLATFVTLYPYIWMSKRIDHLDDVGYSLFKQLNARFQKEFLVKRSVLFYLYDNFTDVMYVFAMWVLLGAPVTAAAYVATMALKLLAYRTADKNRRILIQ